MSASPAVLSGFLGLQTALSSSFDPRTRDGIALTVSEVNGCHYCLAAHGFGAAKFTGTGAQEIAMNRHGGSNDAKVGAAARFAGQVVESRGHVSAVDVEAARQAGFSEPEILKIVALSVEFLFTNFMNSVAGAGFDFPVFDATDHM
jgi:AhpD family alkylhydroperoxidase